MTDIFNQPEANFPSENQSSNSYANQNSGLGGSGNSRPLQTDNKPSATSASAAMTTSQAEEEPPTETINVKIMGYNQKHPCPVKKDDLFYAQQFPVWEAEKNAAEEHIRDLVVAKYDKLQLVGRFQHSDDKFSEQEVAQIKDNGETTKYGGVNKLPESSKVIKMARKETNKVKAKRGNLVCTNLKDHRKKTGRLLLPGANKMRMAA